MAELIENRWTRYGHDRVYVMDSTGDKVGFVDLKERRLHADVEGFDGVLQECLRRWATKLEADQGSESTPSATQPPASDSSGATPPTAQLPDPTTTRTTTTDIIPEVTDLASNAAGQSAQAERDRINSEAPIRNLVARLLGAKTDERNWRVGAEGERRVGRELAKLSPQWHYLHSVKVGSRGSDIDHIVVGPPGLITLNTKCHRNGKAWVAERMVMINGHKTQYLRNSLHEAERAQRLLAEASGWTVPTQAAIVMVGLEKMTVKAMPEDVEVTTCRQLRRWLDSMPTQLTPGQVESVFSVARISTTWTGS